MEQHLRDCYNQWCSGMAYDELVDSSDKFISMVSSKDHTSEIDVKKLLYTYQWFKHK